jgi:hypothetical protein
VTELDQCFRRAKLRHCSWPASVQPLSLPSPSVVSSWPPFWSPRQLPDAVNRETATEKLVPKPLVDGGPADHRVRRGLGHQEATAYTVLEQATTYVIVVHEDEDEGGTIHKLHRRGSRRLCGDRRASCHQKAGRATTQVGRHQAPSLMARFTGGRGCVPLAPCSPGVVP